ELARLRQFDVAVLDMVMGGMSGIELLEQLRALQSECEVIMLTGQGTIEAAVRAMKLGASDFLTKPFPLAELETLIEKAARRRQVTRENLQLKEIFKRQAGERQIVGESPIMRDLMHLVARAAPTDKA